MSFVYLCVSLHLCHSQNFGIVVAFAPKEVPRNDFWYISFSNYTLISESWSGFSCSAFSKIHSVVDSSVHIQVVIILGRWFPKTWDEILQVWHEVWNILHLRILGFYEEGSCGQFPYSKICQYTYMYKYMPLPMQPVFVCNKTLISLAP